MLFKTFWEGIVYEFGDQWHYALASKEVETKSGLFPATFSLPCTGIILRTHKCLLSEWRELTEQGSDLYEYGRQRRSVEILTWPIPAVWLEENSAYFRRLLWGLNEITTVKMLANAWQVSNASSTNTSSHHYQSFSR